MRFNGRAVLARLALVGLGLLLALVALEALLQIAALFVGVSGPTPSATWLSGSQRVICVGDSNTYGLSVQRSEAYPQVLQRLWNADAATPSIEVLNLGVPGMSSSVLRNRFRRILRLFSPNVVLFMIGANDGWTLPAPLDEGADEPPPLTYSLWERSRVFRLLYMISRTFEAHEVELTFAPAANSAIGHSTLHYGGEQVDFTWTGKNAPGIDWQAALGQNLTAMATEARRVGARVLFVTYPSDEVFYGVANRVIARAAAAAGVPLIDVAAEFHRACADQPCPALLRADQHPTPQGYELAATAIKGRLAGIW